jgi:hypothetical protein
MTVYLVVLFVHVVSAMVLAAALRLEILTLIHLRKAATPTEARFVLDLAPGFPVVAMGSLILLLLSGGYMTTQASAWSLAWPRVTMAALVLIGPLGAVSGRKMRAIRGLSASGHSAASELLKKIQDPFLLFSMTLRSALVLGIVLLMTAKPGLTESLEAVGAFAIAGLAAAFLLSRRGVVSPAVSAGSRN